METLNPDECQHERVEIRRKVFANDTHHYSRQCLACGSRVGTWVSRNKIDRPDDVASWDEHLEASGNDRRSDEWQQRSQTMADAREAANLTWWREYENYLQSPDWRRRRAAVLERDNHLCQSCLEAPATQVHHLSYKHFGNEPLFELTSVCDPCHKSLHKTEREPENTSEKWRQLAALAAADTADLAKRTGGAA